MSVNDFFSCNFLDSNIKFLQELTYQQITNSLDAFGDISTACPHLLAVLKYNR